jgi:hypothetical protein
MVCMSNPADEKGLARPRIIRTMVEILVLNSLILPLPAAVAEGLC